MKTKGILCRTAGLSALLCVALSLTVSPAAAKPKKDKELTVKSMIKLAAWYMPDRRGIVTDDKEDLLNEIRYAGITTTGEFDIFFVNYLENGLEADREAVRVIKETYEEAGGDWTSFDTPYSVREDEVSYIVSKGMFYTRAGIIREMIRAMNGEDYDYEDDWDLYCCSDCEDCQCCQCEGCECADHGSPCECCPCNDYYECEDYDVEEYEEEDERYDIYRSRLPSTDKLPTLDHEGYDLNVKTIIHIASKHLPEREGVHHDDRYDLQNDLSYADVETVNDLESLFETYLEDALEYERQLCENTLAAYEEGGNEYVDQYISYYMGDDDLQRVQETGKYFTRAGIIRVMLDIYKESSGEEDYYDNDYYYDEEYEDGSDDDEAPFRIIHMSYAG